MIFAKCAQDIFKFHVFEISSLYIKGIMLNWLLLMYAKELQDDFHGAVDDYLEICKKESIMNRKGLKLQLESLSAQRPALIHNVMSSLILIVRVLSGVQILPIFKESISMG